MQGPGTSPKVAHLAHWVAWPYALPFCQGLGRGGRCDGAYKCFWAASHTSISALMLEHGRVFTRRLQPLQYTQYRRMVHECPISYYTVNVLQFCTRGTRVVYTPAGRIQRENVCTFVCVCVFFPKFLLYLAVRGYFACLVREPFLFLFLFCSLHFILVTSW